MRILFDHSTPRPLRGYLAGHDVDTAAEQGWAELSNGELLDSAEDAGYDVLITPDQSIPYQQNLEERRLSIVVLSSNRWPIVRPKVAEIRSAIEMIETSELVEIVCEEIWEIE